MDNKPRYHSVYRWATKEEFEELRSLPRSYEGDLRKEQIHESIARRKVGKAPVKHKTSYMFDGDTDGKMGKD